MYERSEEGELMDMSKEYIEMCGKAEEIQKGWNKDTWKEGDYWKHTIMGDDAAPYVYDEGIIWYCDDDRYNSVPAFHMVNHELERQVWLPRLDQLIDMMRVWNWGLTWIGHNLDTRERMHWSTWKPAEQEFLPAPTAEQSLLKRVMHEKHGKVWDDNKRDWVIP